MLKSIERQPGKKSQFLSSPLSASVSVMLGAAVTATTTTLTTVVMTTVLSSRAGGTSEWERESGQKDVCVCVCERERERERAKTMPLYKCTCVCCWLYMQNWYISSINLIQGLCMYCTMWTCTYVWHHLKLKAKRLMNMYTHLAIAACSSMPWRQSCSDCIRIWLASVPAVRDCLISVMAIRMVGHSTLVVTWRNKMKTRSSEYCSYSWNISLDQNFHPAYNIYPPKMLLLISGGLKLKQVK